MGLFTAVAPAFLAELLGLPSHVLAGAVVFVVFASSCADPVALEAIAPATGLPLGCVGMIAGAGLIAGGIGASSPALLICGAAVGGFGIGLSFRAGLAAINSEAPSDQRGEVASSFFLIAYLALAVPIIGGGRRQPGVRPRDRRARVFGVRGGASARRPAEPHNATRRVVIRP